MGEHTPQAVTGKVTPLRANDASKKDTPLGSRLVLASTFLTGAAAVAVVAHRTGRVPERIPPGDLVLLGVATHKASRIISKEKVTGFLRAPFTTCEEAENNAEVSEKPRGRGLRKAIGELLTCPFCIGMWVAGGAVATYLFAPRAARLGSSVLAVLSVSDYLQYAWTAADQATED
ncbi:DUF1360 domain-containing protein [Crossiella sp. NPDC003009]